jgi:glutamate-1-semialdehyde 2,1-aminomutase
MFIRQGSGSKIIDVDGNEYIDYLMAYGPLILGHSPPGVVKAIEEQLGRGTMYGAPHELEIKLEEKLVEHIPCAEMVRFANSGAEAVAHAVRVARGYTGRDKIIKFEGHYHGCLDTLLASVQPPLEKAGAIHSPNTVVESAGVPEGVARDIIVLPWNDVEAVEKAVKEHKNEVAAVITEPCMGNTTSIPPEEGYLKALREITQENDIVLIFDEVITGFRLSIGGAQKYYGVTPDIATEAKALGGGVPISAFVGKKEIMQPVATGKVMVSGTYNSNPLVLSAALATLRELESGNGEVYQRLYRLGNKLMAGIRNAIEETKTKAIVQGPGPCFQIIFTELARVRNYREACTADSRMYLRLYEELLKRGIYIAQGHCENWFISAAHSDGDVEKAISAVSDSLKVLKK